MLESVQIILKRENCVIPAPPPEAALATVLEATEMVSVRVYVEHDSDISSLFKVTWPQKC